MRTKLAGTVMPDPSPERNLESSKMKKGPSLYYVGREQDRGDFNAVAAIVVTAVVVIVVHSGEIVPAMVTLFY